MGMSSDPMSHESVRAVFGKRPLCNRRPERAPAVGSFVFPLCWRCSGLVVGWWGGYFLNVPPLVEGIGKHLVGGLLLIPLIVDVALQKSFRIESTNSGRFTSGVLFTLGLHFLQVKP